MNKFFNLSINIDSDKFARFSIKEQTLFAKRMSFLVKAGVPLVDSLSLIRNQTKSKSKGRIFDKVIHDVNNGQFLATSLGKHRHLFSNFAVNLIRVGEESGILSQNLAYLADELHKKDILRRKVVGALIYPIVITLATFGITGILTMYIFPKIMPIFGSLHVTLPLSTRMLIATSDFLRLYSIWLMLAVIAGLVGFAIINHHVKAVRFFWHRSMLSIPIFGGMAKSYNLANFCRTLGLLLKSGVHLADAMIMIAETTNNLAYRKSFENVAASIIKGEPMSRQLGRDQNLFPDILPHMVAVGEATGSLSTTLLYLSELYEGDVDDLTKNLSSAIEPVLMIVMGLLVGFIAISIISPIYAITENIQAH